MLDEVARWDDLVTGLRPMTYGAKGEPARCLVFVGPTTPAKASSEGWRLRLRPNTCLPPEIIMGSPRVHSFDESMQEQLRREDVDFIDERRWRAVIRNARYNQALMRYHQRFVHSRELRVCHTRF
jgi:hypothetical protein